MSCRKQKHLKRFLKLTSSNMQYAVHARIIY